MRFLGRFLALALLAAPAASAAPPKSGTYELAYSSSPATEQVMCLFKIDVKDDGTIEGSLVAAPPRQDVEIKSVSMDGDVLRVAVNLGPNNLSFEGVVTKPDGKVLGSFGDANRVLLARVSPTDKSELAQGDLMKRVPMPAEMTKAQQLTMKGPGLRGRAARATDKEEKEKLLKEATDADADAKTEVPKLYAEVVEKHADSPAALDAAMNLIGQAGKSSAPAAQVEKWAETVSKLAAPYGPRYQAETTIKLAEALGGQKQYAALAVSYAVKAEASLTKKDSTDQQVRVLDALAAAQRAAGETAAADATTARVEKLHAVLDTEYKAKMPPFKPAAFEGRKEKSDRVVVMELFTGAQCPPCKAADLAFDGLEKTYKPTDVVLLQYHMHIPGPDPMTNPTTEGRWAFYRGIHGNNALGGVPASMFNGKPQAGGGGDVPNSERKYKEYRAIIDTALETPAEAAVTVHARRDGNTVKIEGQVSDLKNPGEDKRLRFVLAEEEIRFVGSNKIRFHHMVVRDMPGGADGFKLTAKAAKHTASVDLDALKKSLVSYLDDYAETKRPFPQKARPLAFQHLKVIALVQDDKTGEILQAVQVDLGGDVAAK